MRIAAHGAKRWILVGSGPRRADSIAEYGKFAVKFCNTITVHSFALGNVGKSRINTLKFDRAQIDYPLPEGINVIGGKQCGKIKAVCKSNLVVLFEYI